MCLAIPGKVLSLDGEVARVSINGVICEAGLALAEKIAVGDFVIVHAGFILQKLSSEEAAEELEAIRAALVDPEEA
ncbi:MAG: HypC/HybG/HupF family hydrogenase formation chaperone [Spirochaetales bacterium]|nr:HypC/HybG/HupF family hydrogenase formation chaperone [Spirochaetales bacterium]